MRVSFAAVCAAALLLGGPAFAQSADQSARNTSRAVEESAEGVAALAEAGLKATVGVASVPVAVAAAGSGVAAGSAMLAAKGLVGATAGTSAAANDSAAFSAAPLSVTDDVIVAPQPAPSVPFAPPSPRS